MTHLEYLGCVPCAKGFKLGELTDKHPIFTVIQKDFGLSRNQTKLYYRTRPNEEYNGLYIFKRAG